MGDAYSPSTSPETDRVQRLILLSPVPPQGLGADADGGMLAVLQRLARASDEERVRGLSAVWGDHLAAPWVRFKAERWRAAADVEAVADYAALLARAGLPRSDRSVDQPVLAITGGQDGQPMRAPAILAALGPLCSNLTLRDLPLGSHYPMQESPPLVATWPPFNWVPAWNTLTPSPSTDSRPLITSPLR